MWGEFILELVSCNNLIPKICYEKIVKVKLKKKKSNTQKILQHFSQ